MQSLLLKDVGLTTQADNTGVRGPSITARSKTPALPKGTTPPLIAGPTGGGASNFYMYNLSTGTAVLVGQINGGTPLDDTAVVPVPEPAGLALLCVDASGVLGCRASNQID